MFPNRFVFIGGLHRSGTPLVADLLGSHPSLSGLRNTGCPMNEGMYLQDVLPPEGRYGKLWPTRYLRRLALPVDIRGVSSDRPLEAEPAGPLERTPRPGHGPGAACRDPTRLWLHGEAARRCGRPPRNGHESDRTDS
jgi:hypothetical protein